MIHEKFKTLERCSVLKYSHMYSMPKNSCNKNYIYGVMKHIQVGIVIILLRFFYCHINQNVNKIVYLLIKMMRVLPLANCTVLQ